MKEMFEGLLQIVQEKKVSDVHFKIEDDTLDISVRSIRGIERLQIDFDLHGFYYLKYIAHLDLGNSGHAQSGNFTYIYKGRTLYFRFAYMQTLQTQSGVLRILNNHEPIKVNQLSKDSNQLHMFSSWTRFRGGLTIFSGPTGSGKTTTLHAILHEIAKNKKLKVITLEDPIEIQSNEYLQFQINEKANFTYEEGIKQLLRHDPDVIMIGEVRDEQTAQTLVRCALSGHMVFTTLHAKSCKEAIARLLNFNVREQDLKEVLSAITNQRIFPTKNAKGRICIYEILQKEDLRYFFKHSEHSDKYEDIYKKIRNATHEKWISKEAASKDIEI